VNWKIVQISLKNLSRASKKTHPVSITKIIWLMQFKQIIGVYSDNRTSLINILYGQSAELLNLKACGMYGYHSALKINDQCLHLHSLDISTIQMFLML
jgi:hypothetical protein